MKVLIINGPNLNMLGRREPAIYGVATLDDVKTLCEQTATELGLTVDFRQSNMEGDLISWIHEAMDGFDGVVINPAGFTHSSVAIRDALGMLSIPIMEVHISNPHVREDFRRLSMISPVCTTTITGAGIHGYALAVRQLAHLFTEKEASR